MRVADLARELGLSSVDLMGLLDDLGITVVSDASMLQQSQVRAVRAQMSVRALPLHAESLVPAAMVEEAAAPQNVLEPFIVSARTSAPAPFTVAEPSSPPPAVTNLAETIKTDREWDAALGRARRPILLWGPPGSGKSTFLAGMMFRQTDDDADPFDWRIMPVGMRAGDHIRSVLQAYRAGGQPNATLVTEAPFRFKVRKYRRRRSLWGVITLPEDGRLAADHLFGDPPGAQFMVSRWRRR